MATVVEQRIPGILSWAARASRRLRWGVADQAVSSLTNFVLSLYIAKSLGAEQYGAFTLAYVTYGIANNASRGLAVEPLLIRFSGSHESVWRRAVTACTGTTLLMGVVFGIGALTAGALLDGATGHAFLALGIVFPMLLLQDSWRYSFFALDRGYHAFFNDLAWAAVQLPVMVLLKSTGHADVFWFTFAWGGGAAVGAVIGCFQARTLPNMVRAIDWIVRHRDLGPRYLVENTGTNAGDTVRSFIISFVLGLAAVGYLQAASGVLMGPFRIVLYGLGMITIPEGVRVLRRTPRRLPVYCLGLSGGLSVLAALWGAILLAGMPMGLGYIMLGRIWRPTYPLVLPAALAIIGTCVGIGAKVGLHALGAARRSMFTALFTSLLVIVFAFIGAELGGMIGTISAVAVVQWIGALVSWWQLRKAFHESPTVPVPSWLYPGSAGKHRKPATEDLFPYRRMSRLRDSHAPTNRPQSPRDTPGSSVPAMAPRGEPG